MERLTGVKVFDLVFNEAEQHQDCIPVDEDPPIRTGTISGEISGDSVDGKIDFGDPDLINNIINFSGELSADKQTLSGFPPNDGLSSVEGELFPGEGFFSITKQ